jgi:hypothetical protein
VRQQDDAERGIPAAQGPSCAGAVVRAIRRHADVDDHQVGSCRFDRVDERGRIRDLGDDVMARIGQEPREASRNRAESSPITMRNIAVAWFAASVSYRAD